MPSREPTDVLGPGPFEPGVTAPADLAGPALFFAFRDDELLVHAAEHAARVPQMSDPGQLGVPYSACHYLGCHGAGPDSDPDQRHHCFAVDLPLDTVAPDGMILGGLRRLYGLLGDVQFQLGGRAFQVLNWDRTHRFCGRCGTATKPSPTERARQCPACGLQAFPRLCPAIIVLVSRGREFLLARSPRFPRGRYSIIAGFVEAGETLEEAAVREVREEVGLEIEGIQYFGSQSWPFPNSLMLGFTARHAGGEISIDEDEIEDAGWYTPDRLPDLPDGASISRRLIDHFLASQA